MPRQQAAEGINQCKEEAVRPPMVFNALHSVFLAVRQRWRPPRFPHGPRTSPGITDLNVRPGADRKWRGNKGGLRALLRDVFEVIDRRQAAESSCLGARNAGTPTHLGQYQHGAPQVVVHITLPPPTCATSFTSRRIDIGLSACQGGVGGNCCVMRHSVASAWGASGSGDARRETGGAGAVGVP